MTNDTDIDFDAAGAIQAAIEQAGGTVREFEMKEVQRQQGIFTSLAAMVGGNTERRYIFEVAIDRPTTRDIDVDDDSDAKDALKALAIAHHFAQNEGMDALAADIQGIYNRLGEATMGSGHPSDEAGFDAPIDRDDGREPFQFTFTHPDVDDDASVTVPLYDDDIDDQRVVMHATGASSITVSDPDAPEGDADG